MDNIVEFDAGRTIAETRFGPASSMENHVYIDPIGAKRAVLWEADPTTGGGVATAARFDVTLWHELIGHAATGLTHPEIPANRYLRTNRKSKYVDPVVKIENLARHCLRLQDPKLKLRDRIGKYFDSGVYRIVTERREMPAPGERRIFQ